jgi:hypothetical protein
VEEEAEGAEEAEVQRYQCVFSMVGTRDTEPKNVPLPSKRKKKWRSSLPSARSQ